MAPVVREEPLGCGSPGGTVGRGGPACGRGRPPRPPLQPTSTLSRSSSPRHCGDPGGVVTSSLFISVSHSFTGLLGIKRKHKAKPLPRIHFAEFWEGLLHWSDCFPCLGKPEGKERILLPLLSTGAVLQKGQFQSSLWPVGH